MGQDSTETVKEIEEVRGRLGDQIEELETRLPKPALAAKRGLGVVVGGGLAGTLIWALLKRGRKSRKTAKVEKAAVKAVEQAAENVEPETKRRSTGKTLTKLAIGAGVIWFAYKLAQMRQTRNDDGFDQG